MKEKNLKYYEVSMTHLIPDTVWVKETYTAENVAY